jgi:hypothetical protein
MSEAIDDMIRAAKTVQPDLWKRTEGIARIIDPGAFEEGWTIIEPASAAKLHHARMAVQAATAMRKAHDVLTFLGVNAETDWLAILNRLAEVR